jgi:hypothetical protein
MWLSVLPSKESTYNKVFQIGEERRRVYGAQGVTDIYGEREQENRSHQSREIDRGST